VLQTACALVAATRARESATVYRNGPRGTLPALSCASEGAPPHIRSTRRPRPPPRAKVTFSLAAVFIRDGWASRGNAATALVLQHRPEVTHVDEAAVGHVARDGAAVVIHVEPKLERRRFY
jgi:hypothetical protein